MDCYKVMRYFETSWKVMHYLLELQSRQKLRLNKACIMFNITSNVAFSRNYVVLCLRIQWILNQISQSKHNILICIKVLVIALLYPHTICHVHMRFQDTQLQVIQYHYQLFTLIRKKLDILVPLNDASFKLNIVAKLENIQSLFGNCDNAGKK